MTWYELHRCVFDFIRTQEFTSPGSFTMSDYDLSEAEADAVRTHDVAALHVLGLHGVLLNRYCRQIGLSRDSYRGILSPFETKEEGASRWRT